MAGIGYLYCLLATMVVIAGDYFIKVAAERSLSMTSATFMIGCAMYALSAIGWYLAMREITLGQIAVAFSVFVLLALCAMGVLLFGESIGIREVFGIGFAIAAMILMARFA